MLPRFFINMQESCQCAFLLLFLKPQPPWLVGKIPWPWFNMLKINEMRKGVRLKCELSYTFKFEHKTSSMRNDGQMIPSVNFKTPNMKCCLFWSPTVSTSQRYFLYSTHSGETWILQQQRALRCKRMFPKMYNKFQKCWYRFLIYRLTLCYCARLTIASDQFPIQNKYKYTFVEDLVNISVQQMLFGCTHQGHAFIQYIPSCFLPPVKQKWTYISTEFDSAAFGATMKSSMLLNVCATLWFSLSRRSVHFAPQHNLSDKGARTE